MKLRPGLLATIAALCIAAEAGWGQYVEDSIDVGVGGVGSLAYNSHEDVLYGASEFGVFFAISCDSNRVVRSYPVHDPCAVVYDSTDNKAYCTQYDDSLLVVDGVTHNRIKSLPMYGATIPVWDQASDRVYVSCQNTNEVAIVDCVTDSLLAYIPVGACPIKMSVNTLRHKLYVLNTDDGTVSIVDMTTNQVIKTLPISANTGYYCRSVDEFYCDGPSEKCVVLGGLSDTIVAQIPLPGTSGLYSATGNEAAGLVYLGTASRSGGDCYLATVSAERDSVLATASTGRSLYGLAYASWSGLVYCASGWSDKVYVLTGDGTRILTTLAVGDFPFVFAAVPRHDRLYVGHLNGTYVYVLRDTSAGVFEQQPRPKSAATLIAWPNPFARSVTLARRSPTYAGDDVRVYAQDGCMVRQARIPSGEVRWVWDGRDDSGALLPPGVYVIEAGPDLRAKVVKLK